ncbi:hypothetical protein UT300005_24530 [Clostridium sp. CTA-5]
MAANAPATEFGFDFVDTFNTSIFIIPPSVIILIVYIYIYSIHSFKFLLFFTINMKNIKSLNEL